MNKTLEDLKGNKIESLSNVRNSIKGEYTNYIDSMVNKAELFKQKSVVLLEKIYNTTKERISIYIGQMV